MSEDALETGLQAKRTATLLRDARAVLRKVDVLAATAAAVEDPVLPDVAEARAAVERVLRQLERRGAGERRRGGRLR